MGVGAAATVLTGSIMQWTDPSFGFMGLKAAGFNAGMMALVGAMFGVFSQMGFFAYLTLTYIALSIFRKKYLWNALQGYTTLFAIFFFGYILYENRDQFGAWMFLVFPVLLAVAAWIVGTVKAKQTNASGLVPTLFLMIVGTLIEVWPSLGAESNRSALIFMLVPLFVCNAYQILMLHRLVKQVETGSAAGTKPVL
jgi:KinB signaling pathway activation protein